MSWNFWFLFVGCWWNVFMRIVIVVACAFRNCCTFYCCSWMKSLQEMKVFVYFEWSCTCFMTQEVWLYMFAWFGNLLFLIPVLAEWFWEWMNWLIFHCHSCLIAVTVLYIISLQFWFKKDEIQYLYVVWEFLSGVLLACWFQRCCLLLYRSNRSE